MNTIQNGKGSRLRPVMGEEYRSNFDRIFGVKKIMTSPFMSKKKKSKKKNRIQCPHCARNSFIKNTKFTGYVGFGDSGKCIKCKYER